MALAKEDRETLAKLLRHFEENEEIGEIHENSARAFERWVALGLPLTDKQRAWARGLAEKLLGEVTYENLASSGKLCRGREVSTPAVLQNLPKKPPVRRL